MLLRNYSPYFIFNFIYMKLNQQIFTDELYVFWEVEESHLKLITCSLREKSDIRMIKANYQ